MMDSMDEKLLEAGNNEDILFVPPAGNDLQWCCIYTRPRHEKKVAEICDLRGVNYYLPLRRAVYHYKSGKKVRLLPLFSSYVFCCPNPEQRIELSSDERTLSVIDVFEQEQFIHELLQIQRSLQVCAELETVPYLAQGQPVEVVRGPFAGIKGIVEKVKGKHRVMLIATMMNRSVPLEVDVADVEPYD